MASGRKLTDVQTFASAVESAGLDGMVFVESGRTAYLSVAAAALAAPSLQYSTGIAVAFPRSPMVTAKVAWELQDLTDGKFRLGLGTQVRAHIERRYGVEFDPPGPRIREYIQAVKHIFPAFRGESPLDFDGQLPRAVAAARHVVAGAHRFGRPAGRRRRGRAVDGAHGRRGGRRCPRPPVPLPPVPGRAPAARPARTAPPTPTGRATT